ncbi:hypothetical protein BJY04DRAFT_218879 [Aspergillus karnatakaensis]|uniref:YoaK family protein n=1 Tax=Aspergillus karnatakaensis TaxID=1810916 RepID=UPI003CCCFDFE
MRPRETDGLLGNTRTPNQASSSNPQRCKLASHFAADINPERTELILLFCYILTGILDSSAVLIWGSFVSMQTGNTVYLGLGAIGADPSTRWYRAATSIASFCAGSWCFSSFYRWGGKGSPRRRWLLCAVFLIQLLCVAVAATIATVQRLDERSSSTKAGLDWQVLLSLALVAFQSSGQAVSSRVLDRKSLTSVVLTSVYCDLFSVSPVPVHGQSFTEDLKRLGAIVCLILGVFIGGLWAKSSIGIIGALWTVVVGKALIVFAWAFWKEGGLIQLHS